MADADGGQPTMSDDTLGDTLGAAILGDLAPEAGQQDHLAIVRRTAQAEQEVRSLLRQAVASARGAGHSWAVLGAELGMSRQAAQQRFGEPRDQDDAETTDGGPGNAEERWLGPVTAFDEMGELALAGRLGWRTVGAGVLRHRVRRTPTQWEHRRVVWTGSAARFERDGWVVGVRAFPWLYLVRDTGLPAEQAPSSP
ncbi:hypothetical protein [Nocardioides sp. OK12]|uniref:hypothetical protein n=1 Tax=Nocardioides sp. OK12 TaxID=2758661 RepID=UPI0021C2F285|nr:hypothetical protein [Nocardioides sp. OK12]